MSAIDDAAFLPGGAKYDDLPGFLAVAAPSPLWLAGEGPKPPAVVAAAYSATGTARALTVSPLRGPQATADAVKWLVR